MSFPSDGGNLYCATVGLLLAHEDKSDPGALIASPSIPWGEAKGDESGCTWLEGIATLKGAVETAGDFDEGDRHKAVGPDRGAMVQRSLSLATGSVPSWGAWPVV